MKMRSYYLNQTIKYLDTEFVKVISGVRRSGKSFLLKMLKNKLDQEKKETLYLDFEHPDTLICKQLTNFMITSKAT
ncbi:MAG: AAA family ATPase [Acholeplasmataceae bacterium]